MSCNGCRVLRKGCNDKCILRQSLSGIESSQAQSNATVFVAKFFGRAGLMSFLSAVPDSQRPALFQSLLFEACGRTINPVSGAVGLLWTGNWQVCQSAVESVLRGGLIHAIPQFTGDAPPLNSINESLCTNNTIDINFFGTNNNTTDAYSRGNLESCVKVENNFPEETKRPDLDLCLTNKRKSFMGRMTSIGRPEKRRAGTPNSDESDTTTFESGTLGAGAGAGAGAEDNNKLLRLFF